MVDVRFGVLMGCCCCSSSSSFSLDISGIFGFMLLPTFCCQYYGSRLNVVVVVVVVVAVVAVVVAVVVTHVRIKVVVYI